MRTLETKTPYSFQQSLAFIAGFRPCRDACVLGDGAWTGAVSVEGRAYAFTVREGAGVLEVETHGPATASVEAAVAAHVRDKLSIEDDLAAFYAAADGDPEMTALVRELHGLHHVRFGGLADAVVYAILMQRAPMQVAAALKRKFLAKLGHAVEIDGTTLHAMPSLAKLGHAVEIDGTTLHAMPSLAELAVLDEDAIAGAIGHRPKSARIAGAVRAVRDIGETFLRTAPYEQAREALLEIDGVGPFAAAAILLRGLGRMDDLPWMPQFARAAEHLYGRTVSEQTLSRRYGRHIGYWSFYAMTGLGRRSRAVH